MASRYTGSRYDGDSRRSRSRDRSPDRRSLYSDGGPRRSSAESRANSSAFQANRDSFRDTLPRDTPRGPKALLDPPSGPRGGGYSGDFRGRGRGRARAWRDDSRDRGRDRDIDFRDRRDTSYRDERSRERDRGDWRDRDRDSFRGRRPSPRARSPPGRDFRDSRDLRDGLGVDADRARRGSRDGPLSAGSSSSDPPFGHSSYRGGYSNRGRGGRGRGGGDWDNRPRGRAAFYDDRDRYGTFRSRSQEGRFRDREDRDREPRYLDPDLRPHPRDDRDARDREVRPKIDRTSHEPPQAAKDVSPPPVAPAAPSFGSVPNRTTTSADIGSATGKAPPTGPRALKEDRPAPIVAPPSVVDTRAPPTGPSKSSFVERSPPIPSGPRSTRSGPSSKQWINPNLKNRVPESPKLGRSQSFAQARPAGFRPEGSHPDQQGDAANQRPRSSDAKADSQVATADDQLRDLHLKESSEEAYKYDRRPQSAGSSLDRDYRMKDAPDSAKTDDGAAGTIDHSVADDSVADKDAPVPEETKARPNRRPTLKMPIIHVSLPNKQVKQPIIDQSSESDDEEVGDFIESGLADVEAKLKQYEGTDDIVPMDAIIRHAMVCVEALGKVVTEPEGLVDMAGPIPEDAVIPGKTPTKPDVPVKEATVADEVVVEKENMQVDVKPAHKEKTPSLVVEPTPAESTTLKAELPQPSIEQDIDMPAPHEPVVDEKKPRSEDDDVRMEDVEESRPVSEVPPPPIPPVPASRRQSLFPPFEDVQIQSRGGSKRGSSTPSPQEDEDETDVEDIDLQSIEVVREHMVTPPIDSLPYFDEKPWDKDYAFIQSMNAPHLSLDHFILKRFKEEACERLVKEDRLRQEYDAHYAAYLRFTRSDDPVAVKSREKFDYASGITEGSSQKPGFNADQPKQESTRRSRYASERDLERILEESRRVEDEKRERQLRAEQEKYRTDTKEAVIPCQYLTPEDIDNDFYNDTTGYINAEKTVAAWQVLPPVANFTEEETAIFEKAYLEFPKQWGRVSEPLLERDFGTAIQFYYLKKEKSELNLKEKLKKQPRRRKKGGRGKQRSSALVSELGNGDNETEETQETGENGERRRPRRAAAPTFNSEATPATDGESGTPAGTPGRRGGGSRGDGSEKPERKPRGRRAAKDKEPKQPRVNQTLAAAPPPPGAKGNRSRSSSRVQGPDWIAQQAQNDTPRVQPQYELAPNTAPVPPVAMQATFQPTQPLMTPERGPPPAPLSEVMAPPPLRPEPPPQPTMSMLDMGQSPLSDRKSNTQASSYWSVPETTDFPSLLRSFGSDWAAIAGHMRTKTAVMVKNYYSRRKDTNDWEAIVQEADSRKARGEKRPPPPMPSSGVKKRYDASVSRPLAAADTIMDDAPPTKLEHPSTPQAMTGRFNVPIAAQPQPPVVQSPFVQTPQPSPLVQAHATSQPGAQPLAQAVTQTMSPSTRPLRAPLPFSDRERADIIQQPGRTPLVQKPTPPAPPPISEPPMRHPLPVAFMDSQAERPKPEPKPQREPARHQERPITRVKQEPDLVPQHHQHELFAAQPPPGHRMTNSRTDIPLSRPPEPPRAVAPAPQAPFAAVLQQQQPNRGLLSENHPSPPAPRPLSNLSNLSRPMSGASGGAEPYSTPPAQRTPPAVAPPPSRPPERKTSNLMALLNDDPPPPPKRVIEVPAAVKPASTPPPQSNPSRPPPPPPPPSHVRREQTMSEAQAYDYRRNPPPPAPSSMPSLKPYAAASPQTQPMGTPRHMPMESVSEREYYGRGRPYSTVAHQPPAASSPQSAHTSHHYPPPSQPAQMQYQQPQAPYPYGAQVQPQQPSVASPPPQYPGHPSAPRGHEPPPSSRDTGWPGIHQGHGLPPQHQQPQQPQPAWASQPPQPPKSTQPPPTQSAWAAQHAPTPKPPPPPSASSVPPQPSWATAPPPPRGHDPMALRDVRDLYPQHRMQTLQAPYAPSPRAPEPPPPQPPAGYPRYSTPVPGRDPREPGPPRSYTPVSAYERVYQPSHDIREAHREAHLREQQSILQQQQQQQLRQDRHLYERQHERPPPDRYGR